MIIKKEKVVKYATNGTRYVLQPEHIKRQAVEELESGFITLNQAMKKYEVNRPFVINSWLFKYSKNPEQYGPKKKHTSAEIKQIVRDIERGKLTRKEARIKHNVSKNAVAYWVKKYSSHLSCIDINNSKMQKTKRTTGKIIEKELQEANLKIAGLETMIDLAEEQYKIEIRKKFGTKQSN